MQLAISRMHEQVFASLKVRNYRLYFFGQGLSHVGNWMHTVALGWLVLELSGSGTVLGGLLALRFLPLFVGPLFSSFLVDSFDKRRILFTTQSLFAALALFMSVLVFENAMQLWMLYLFALVFGVVDAIDIPTRQTFVHQVVGPDRLRNAVALNSTEANVARAIGPLLAGTLIASVGIAFCFFVNALSFFGLIVALFRMRRQELQTEHVASRTTVHLLSGLRYAASVPTMYDVLVSMAVIGTLSYEFQTSLPLLARITFHGGATDYAVLLSAMGVGSVAGGVYAASRGAIRRREYVTSALLFGFSMCVTALMPNLPLAIVGLIFVGFFSISLTATGNAMVQLSSDDSMRGRVMALWYMALFGSTVIGAPIVGWIGEHVDPRAGLLLGGASAILAGLWAASRMQLLNTMFTLPAFISAESEEATEEKT